jgi:hypothetical protein
MSGSGGADSGLVKIYTARNALESSLIRKVLTAEGIRVLIPAEEFDDVVGAGLEPEAIFVPVIDRDRALQLLSKAWEFFDSEGKASGGEEQQ